MMNTHGTKKMLSAAAVALACVLALPAAQAADKWLHIRVDEAGAGGEKIDVNIPLDVVESVLPLIQIDDLDHGKLRIHGGDLEGIDLRELAHALRDAPDADFIVVEGRDESVRVAKENEFLVVHVEDRGGRSNERVRIRVPLAIVDALVGDDPDELDLAAAIRVLGEYEGQALVDVESDDGSVRVWIDSSKGAR